MVDLRQLPLLWVGVPSFTRRHLLSLLALIAAVGPIIAFPLGANALDVHIKTLTRDPYSAAEAPWYFGYFALAVAAISIAGTAAILGIAWVLNRCLGYRLTAHNPRFRLLCSLGLLGFVMGIDDLLLLHDGWADALGIPEPLFHLAYLVWILWALAQAGTALWSTPWSLIIGSLVGFAMSSVLDTAGFLPEALRDFEDVPKASGAILWVLFLGALAWQLVSEAAGKTAQPETSEATSIAAT